VNLGLDNEFVAFILAALVCREDGRVFSCHPSAKSDDPVFETVAQSWGFSPKHIRRWLKKLPTKGGLRQAFNNRPRRERPKPLLS
jgi:hypothetical protein